MVYQKHAIVYKYKKTRIIMSIGNVLKCPLKKKYILFMYKILNSDIIYMAYCFNGCRIYVDL